MEYVYSLNDEDYYDIETIFDQLNEMCADSGKAINYDMEIYKAEKVVKKHSDFVDISSLLERMSEIAYESGEYAERYCDDLDSISKEHMKVLKLLISPLIDEHLNNVIGEPSFYTIANAIKIKLKDADAGT